MSCEREFIRIAFYKNGEGFVHRVVRWYTASPYSHAIIKLTFGNVSINLSRT